MLRFWARMIAGRGLTLTLILSLTRSNQEQPAQSGRLPQLPLPHLGKDKTGQSFVQTILLVGARRRVFNKVLKQPPQSTGQQTCGEQARTGTGIVGYI